MDSSTEIVASVASPAPLEDDMFTNDRRVATGSRATLRPPHASRTRSMPLVPPVEPRPHNGVDGQRSEMRSEISLRIEQVRHSWRSSRRGLKRGVDIGVSLAVLFCFAPLMTVLALLIKLESRGPALFVQERVGRDGETFNLLKFRSMRVDAEAWSGPVFAKPNDPRCTRMGRFMRRFSLDELPQFINVLRGDMSIVGPRPERPYFVAQFSQSIPRYMDRHREKSGITGWAQINGLRGDTSIERRTHYDLYYVENWSLAFDLQIMLRTIREMLQGRNAY